MSQRLPPTRWELEFETTSPLFLGGADPNERAELRAPSLRGALRAWYRLLVGPKIAARGDQAGRFSESSIFGGTATGDGQGRVLLRVPTQVSGQKFWKPPKERRSEAAYWPSAGANYLGFSLSMDPNQRKAIPEETSFTVQSIHPRGLTDEESARLAGAWWLLCALGGLGSRSRRGFGSLAPKRWPPRVFRYDGEPVTFVGPALPRLHGLRSVRELRDGIGQGLRALFRMHGPNDPLVTGAGEFQPVYHLAFTPDVRVVSDERRPWATPMQALEALGKHMSAFRRQMRTVGLPAPAMAMLEAGHRLPRAPAAVAFGLPLSFQRKQAQDYYALGPAQKWRPRAEEQDSSTSFGRVPSPILISLKRLGTGRDAQTVAVITRLSGEIPGVRMAVAYEGEPQRDIPANPNNPILQSYLNDLKSAFTVQEVRL